jgi:[protein-PII] uridylyltransferase
MKPAGKITGKLASGGSIAAALRAARTRAAAGLRVGKNGLELAESLTLDIERMVVRLVGRHLSEARMGAAPGVAVLATGGFGRREFAPYSDLDLMFLCADAPDARIADLARAILHPLWDARIDAGHAVRSVADALALPARDLTAATALLDARYLAGDRTLADRFLALYGARVAGSAPDGFIARLRAEQRARHSRFGDTIFLLQPDLKNGPGGVRDLCAGRWAALARFGTGNPRALCDLGEMSARQAAALEAAREWLLRVRVAVHLAARRRQDQLRFDMQEKVAPLLYGNLRLPAGDIRPAVAPAVEALMHDFQRHAKAVSRESERLIARASADPQREPRVAAAVVRGRADESFELRDGALEVTSPAVFDRRPSEMIRLFQVAADLDAQVGLYTTDLIAERAARPSPALCDDPDAAACFLQLLTDVRDRATPSRLEQMQDLGLLGALMPEWQPVTGRVQHDIYHAYTVDQHLLYTVARMKSLARGEHAGAHPVPSREIRSVERPVVLYLGTLLHDVGKPLGRNHSIKGAVLAVAIARRLGLSDEDVRRVEFLVREHLVMGHTSQRRDLDDALFARLCGGRQTIGFYALRTRLLLSGWIRLQPERHLVENLLRLMTLLGCEAERLCPAGACTSGEPERMDALLRREVDALRECVRWCASIKARIVHEDERERGPRRLLNYGHTVGHALEILAGGSLTHGEAIAIGMNVEARIAGSLGLAAEEVVRRQEALLQRAGLPAAIPRDGPGVDEALGAMRLDKKVRHGGLRLTLVGDPGKGVIDEPVPDAVVKEVLVACRASS